MLRVLKLLLFFAVVAGLVAAATLSRDLWLPHVFSDHAHDADHDHGPADEPGHDHDHAADPDHADTADHDHDHDHAGESDTDHDHAHDHAAGEQMVTLSPQARRNLGLTSKPLQLTSGWRTIAIPGTITERPGISDRGVTSPVVGVVTAIHAYPGDTVRPGERLFTLRLLSEYVQTSQAALFKATRETELETEKRERLEKIGAALPGVRLIEIDQQLRRLQATIESSRQDLLSRGLSPEQIEQAAAGSFVSTVEILAPPPLPQASAEPAVPDDPSASYEVQQLEVDLGNQVQAGQLLATLANHRLLYAVGHAFKGEAAALEEATREGWPVELEFAEDDPAGWEPLPESFRIRHIANTIDPASRTFDFFVPLTNQSRSYQQGGEAFVVWRFRPGQRVRLHVPIERLTDVFVVPAEAVVREGAEAFVFRDEGEHLDRLPVQLLHADRLRAFLADDGSLEAGWNIAQSAAASLNRVLASQSGGDADAGVHVHADGTVHGAH